MNGLALRHFASRMNLEVVSLGHDPQSPRWARGVVTMIKLVRHGCDAMVAADGPHGPALQAKAGAALIALRAQGVIVPSSAACTRKIELRHRWDKHLVPLPFSRTLVHFGLPIDAWLEPGPQPALEDLRAQMAEALETGADRAVAALHEQARTRF
ncbi:MAG: hypothetical protein KGJ86_21600, partial [Chloroflexota bacterium]|nr:hypothetical protein [Chloroflexota bacterium]